MESPSSLQAHRRRARAKVFWLEKVLYVLAAVSVATSYAAGLAPASLSADLFRASWLGAGVAMVVLLLLLFVKSKVAMLGDTTKPGEDKKP